MKKLDYPPLVVTFFLLGIAFFGCAGGRFGWYVAIVCIGLWLGWIIIWNYVIKDD